MATLGDALTLDAEKRSQESVTKEASADSDVSSQDSGYPEGGYEATMTLIGACLANFVQFGLISLIGVLQAQ